LCHLERIAAGLEVLAGIARYETTEEIYKRVAEAHKKNQQRALTEIVQFFNKEGNNGI
jgi:hypothetical protein